MDDQGWIKLHRQIQNNELWLSEKFTRAQAWVDLLLLANHKDGMFFLRGNEVKVKKGQVARAERTLAKRWRWSRDKVRRFLEWLKTRQQIRQQQSNVINILEIINYERYQQNDTTDKTTKKPQKDHRQDTYNNVKNEKNEKKKELAKKVIDYLNLKANKNYKHSTAKTIEAVSARASEGFELEDFKKVVDNKVEDWLRHEKWDKFLRPETLFSNKFEGYLNQNPITQYETPTKRKEHVDKPGEDY